MRFCEDFGRLLAFSVAIRRRDEVAVKQFLQQIATEVHDAFDEAESLRAPQPRSTEAARRKRERLNAALSSSMAELKGLVDKDGMTWLREQLPH